MLACLVGIAFTGNVQSATYYVSADGGDDSDGTTATGAGRSGPWKTLANLARTPLVQGDQVLLRCGDHFTGAHFLTG
jgi:hypothetical protein